MSPNEQHLHIKNYYKNLLFNNNSKTSITNIKYLLSEARAQTIFPLVFNILSKDSDLSAYQSEYFSIISNNVKVFEEHKRIHKLLCENDIQYVFLKGCASARYYPDQLLRTMGDVDLLVWPEDTEKVDGLLISAGYEKQIDSDDYDSHISYKSKNGVVCELHRQINGIPKNETSEKISKLFSNIFEDAELVNNEYLCPSNFHHGLIMLLHTATHLTHEGIGLRHLCDWAVFIEKFSDQEFCDMYKKPLEEIGLWKFACILSACSIKYLGCSRKESIGNIDVDLIDAVIQDISSSGNFGRKDYSRYQQIKYISNSQNREISKSTPISQAFSNLISKAKRTKFVKKYSFMLPLGCIWVAFEYLLLVITGKRKLDSKKTIESANERKNIYSEFELFKH